MLICILPQSLERRPQYTFYAARYIAMIYQHFACHRCFVNHWLLNNRCTAEIFAVQENWKQTEQRGRKRSDKEDCTRLNHEGLQNIVVFNIYLVREISYLKNKHTLCELQVAIQPTVNTKSCSMTDYLMYPLAEQLSS